MNDLKMFWCANSNTPISHNSSSAPMLLLHGPVLQKEDIIDERWINLEPFWWEISQDSVTLQTCYWSYVIHYLT